ncbi:hypothetical protein Tsubulata_005008 [Turnera subulata]|uniref:SET domain-containing protein n=1 Tax=Turnera subulata TaxID=218843 RepID=A0A9Q0J4L3_9ROSI|nr:hypothetical protein Tsubulata_005008 [Turnera subulata]
MTEELSSNKTMEESKLSSSDKIVETDAGFTIVLELSQDELFFDKKKNLLRNKGFDIREEIQLESSATPDSISTTLEKLLEVARIKRLDEVELYFDEANEYPSAKYFSSRNEVEALNSILYLVNNFLRGKTEKEGILQRLADAIVDRIQVLANKNRVETRIDTSCTCDKEKCLVEWGERNGVRTNLEIACVMGAGRGAIATKDLEVGDIALEIPVSLIISEEVVHGTNMYHILENLDGVSSETMLLLWSMKERHNCSSKFKMYFDTLPKDFNTGLGFGVDAIVSLEGTLLLEEIMLAKEHLREQYDKLVLTLCSNNPDVFPPHLYTWEQFLWACELWYSNSMKILFADGKLRTCLIPIAGFLNHSLYPHIVNYGKVHSATNTLKFPLSRPCHVGEQCCLSYGNYSSSHFITFYGFLPQGDNPYDVISLDVGEADRTEDCSISGWSTHMVRGTWFSNNHTIFHYGFPSPLLDYLRRAQSPELDRKTITQSNLQNEIEVLEILQSIFSEMMQNHGTDTDMIDSENDSWDVKLATEYKDLQRRIISSILASCDAGIELVQTELSKMNMLA